jgi:hypothetical protein
MTARIDPRADLIAPVFDHRAFYSRPTSVVSDYDRRSSTYGLPSAAYPKKKPCFDWVFSSASNVHLAVDRSAFNTYTPFRSYVLALADQRQVPVKGISTVELKIRRQAGSKDIHKVVLEDVLHVPSWLCNILSDIHFVPARDFEHNWSEFGVSFQQKKDDKWKPWGYTENFCGLERIVLGKHMHGRSPMLEDKDREVFSVNITWPQHQRDKYDMLVEEQERRIAEVQQRRAKIEVAKEAAHNAEEEKRTEAARKASEEDAKDTNAAELPNNAQEPLQEAHRLSESPPSTPKRTRTARTALSAIDGNLKVKRSLRSSSLRVPGKSAFREALPWRRSIEQ